jgi:non-ribosomal peptide synthetase component E (peptide arylation enzyme)
VSWPAQTLGEVLQSRIPQAEALVTRNGRFTYQQLLELAKKAAGSLQALGIRKGDHVGILMGTTSTGCRCSTARR